MIFGLESGTVLGASPILTTVRVIVRQAGGLTTGALAAFDMSLTSPSTTNYTIGHPNSAWVCVRTPVAGDLTAGFFCILLEDIAENEEGNAAIGGVISATTDGGSINRGVVLTGNTSGQLSGTVAAGYKYLARKLGASGTGSPTDVIFDGIYGFGTKT